MAPLDPDLPNRLCIPITEKQLPEGTLTIKLRKFCIIVIFIFANSISFSASANLFLSMFLQSFLGLQSHIPQGVQIH